MRDAFGFVDPAIALRGFIPFLLRSLELFQARFRPIFLVSRAARLQVDRINDPIRPIEDIKRPLILGRVGVGNALRQGLARRHRKNQDEHQPECFHRFRASIHVE